MFVWHGLRTELHMRAVRSDRAVPPGVEKGKVLLMRGSLLSCVVGILSLVAGGAESADWPQWLGPTRNGVSTEAVEPWKAQPKVVWRQKINKAFSSPIVADGLVFVHASLPGKEVEEVVALEASTGKLRWRDSYPRAKYRSQLGTGPRATPNVADGKLVTYGITGTLTCYEARTGAGCGKSTPMNRTS